MYYPAIKKGIGLFAAKDGWETNYMCGFEKREAAEQFAAKWAQKEQVTEFKAVQEIK